MPLYEYQCTACGRLTEKRQKFSDPELTECPYCGGRLERTITAPAVQFKGGGWYADLYSKGGGKKPAANAGSEGSSAGDLAKSDSGSTSESSGKSEGGSTAAPATSTPAASAAPSSTPAK